MQNAIHEYLEWKGSYTTRAPLAYALYLTRFKNQIAKRPEDITLQDILQFQKTSTNAAYASVVIKDFLKFLICIGVKCINPLLIRIPKQDVTPHATLDPDEFEAMNNLLRRNEFRDTRLKSIIGLLWDSGMRVSEICELNIDDIDNQKRMAKVRTRKNRELDWVKWSEKTHHVLMGYLGMRLCLNQQQPLFIKLKGPQRTRLTTRSVERLIEELAKRAGITKHITPHSFRHGKAHNIIAQGGTVKDVQAILRHNNPMSSFAYLRFSPVEFEKTADRFL